MTTTKVVGEIVSSSLSLLLLSFTMIPAVKCNPSPTLSNKMVGVVLSAEARTLLGPHCSCCHCHCCCCWGGAHVVALWGVAWALDMSWQWGRRAVAGMMWHCVVEVAYVGGGGTQQSTLVGKGGEGGGA